MERGKSKRQVDDENTGGSVVTEEIFVTTGVPSNGSPCEHRWGCPPVCFFPSGPVPFCALFARMDRLLFPVSSSRTVGHTVRRGDSIGPPYLPPSSSQPDPPHSMMAPYQRPPMAVVNVIQSTALATERAPYVYRAPRMGFPFCPSGDALSGWLFPEMDASQPPLPIPCLPLPPHPSPCLPTKTGRILRSLFPRSVSVSDAPLIGGPWSPPWRPWVFGIKTPSTASGPPTCSPSGTSSTPIFARMGLPLAPPKRLSNAGKARCTRRGRTPEACFS